MSNLKGIVVAKNASKTVTVAVGYVMSHPKYKKIIKRTTKLAAHSEREVKIGDQVQLVKSRPFSKAKHFRVL